MEIKIHRLRTPRGPVTQQTRWKPPPPEDALWDFVRAENRWWPRVKRWCASAYWRPLVLANLRNSRARADVSGYANLLHVRWLKFEVLVDWGTLRLRKSRHAS